MILLETDRPIIDEIGDEEWEIMYAGEESGVYVR